MEDVVRDIKLSKIIGNKPNELSVRVIDFFDKLFVDMIVKVDISKGEIICYKEGHDYYFFEQESKNGNLWCDYDKVCSFLSKDLNLNYNDTQAIITFMVEKHLNIKVGIPRSGSVMDRWDI